MQFAFPFTYYYVFFLVSLAASITNASSTIILWRLQKRHENTAWIGNCDWRELSECQQFGNRHFGHIVEIGKNPLAMAMKPTANCDANLTAASSSLSPSMVMVMAITKMLRRPFRPAAAGNVTLYPVDRVKTLTLHATQQKQLKENI